MGRPAGRQRQPQADGAKAEKQTNVEKATDMQQRHAENKRKGGECKEKDVSRRKGQGSCQTIGFNERCQPVCRDCGAGLGQWCLMERRGGGEGSRVRSRPQVMGLRCRPRPVLTPPQP